MKLQKNIDTIGTFGIFITAIFSPCCFPLFAFAASALGLGSFELFGGWTMWVFQAMAVIAVIGLYVSYRQHSCVYPLLIAVPSVLLILYGYHFNDSEHWVYFLYAGMLGLMAATGINYYKNKRCNACNSYLDVDDNNAELVSEITCPNCGHKKKETMPTDACQFFYECEQCKTRLKPKQGDCCVYCSYGTVKCPPMQTGSGCC